MVQIIRKVSTAGERSLVVKIDFQTAQILQLKAGDLVNISRCEEQQQIVPEEPEEQPI